MKTDTVLGISPGGFHQIAYSEWGTSALNETPIICVHGLTRNRHDFDALASYLSQQERHIFCPDIVGRGDSDWFKNPEYYTFQQYMSDVSMLIARTGAKKVDFIGTSMGGLIGMMLAALPNSPIARLVLNDIGPIVPIQGLRRLASYTSHRMKFSSIDEAKAYYKNIYADFGNLSEAQWYELTLNSISLKPSGFYVPKCDPEIMHNATKTHFLWELMQHPYKTLQGIFFDLDFWHLWQDIKCPILVIHGRHSDILLQKHVAQMQETHPQTVAIEVEDAGHAPALLERKEHEKIAQWIKDTA